ncbi:MAG: ACT domain-containing protein [Ruminococcaceae bacterium]|nr:ACT domain-containing protein [Oscillospiraceae bacterium]
MKAIVTVVGQDQVGIIAGVCNTLAAENINVLDISQTIMQGFFTMMMVVDLSACTTSFDKLGEALRQFGEGRGLAIRIQREDIFDAMHKI